MYRFFKRTNLKTNHFFHFFLLFVINVKKKKEYGKATNLLDKLNLSQDVVLRMTVKFKMVFHMAQVLSQENLEFASYFFFLSLIFFLFYSLFFYDAGTLTMGSIYYIGTFEYGLKHGTGVLEYGNGIKYDGQWEDDSYHGTGVWMNTQAGHTYEGEFVNGKKCGFGTMKYGHGDVYEGQWKNDFCSGKGDANFKNGDSYSGNWRLGKVFLSFFCTFGQLSKRFLFDIFFPLVSWKRSLQVREWD